jgi:hypothetical protein
MKSLFSFKSLLVLASVVITALPIGAIAQSPPQFNNASLNGNYGAHCQGFDGNNGSLSALRMVAIQSYDGRGRGTDTSFYSVSGDIAKNAIYNGTYNIIPDGTGSILWAPTGETYDIALSKGGKEINWVNTSFQQYGRNFSCIIKKVGTVNSIAGSFAWVGGGYYDKELKQRVSFTGRIVLGQSDTVTGSYTTAVNGSIKRSLTFTGKYNLAADKKTGTITIKDQTGRTDEMFFVPVNDGTELFVVSTKSGNTISSQMTKQ